MDKIFELLKFVDKGHIGTVKKVDVEVQFEKFVVDEAIQRGFLLTQGSGRETTCKLSQAGYSFLNGNKSVQLQIESDKKQTRLGTIGVILAVVAIIVAVLLAVHKW